MMYYDDYLFLSSINQRIMKENSNYIFEKLLKIHKATSFKNMFMIINLRNLTALTLKHYTTRHSSVWGIIKFYVLMNCLNHFYTI